MIRSLRQLKNRLAKTSPARDEPAIQFEEAKRTCPHCKARVDRGATVCIHCERDLAPLMDPIVFAQRFGKPGSEQEK